MKEVEITASASYRVVIGSGLKEQLPTRLVKEFGDRFVLVTDSNVERLYGASLLTSLRSEGAHCLNYVVPAGEESKSMERLEALLEFMAENLVQRSDVVVAFGGGVVGDLAGFAAAVYQRGIKCVQIPTSLLAAVDSSVGGKTAVNLAAGKNLVGAFAQPAAVYCDPELFCTMDETAFADGVAEIVKYAVLMSPQLFHRLQDPLKSDSEDMEEIVEKCVRYKAKIVKDDEYDRGSRQLLNLGHTFGHAIEKAGDYTVSHGHAVSIGMAMMARACAQKGICSEETARSIEDVLTANRLPLRAPYSAEELFRHAKGDKKAQGEGVNVIVIRDVGQCEIRTVSFKELEEWIRLGGAP